MGGVVAALRMGEPQRVPELVKQDVEKVGILQPRAIIVVYRHEEMGPVQGG